MEDQLSGATCDACGPGTRSVSVTGMPSGDVLTYCGSHTRQYRQGIENQGGVIWITTYEGWWVDVDLPATD